MANTMVFTAAMQAMETRLVERTPQTETKIRNADDSDDGPLAPKHMQNKQKPRKAGPRSLLFWDKMRLDRLKVKSYITRDISNGDFLGVMFQRILLCLKRGREMLTVRAWL
jgi:hypothetical protein